MKLSKEQIIELLEKKWDKGRTLIEIKEWQDKEGTNISVIINEKMPLVMGVGGLETFMENIHQGVVKYSYNGYGIDTRLNKEFYNFIVNRDKKTVKQFFEKAEVLNINLPIEPAN